MPQQSYQTNIINTAESIATPHTKDTIQKNVNMQTFIQADSALLNTFGSIQGSISSQTIQEDIEKYKIKNEVQLEFLHHSNAPKIPIYEYINKLNEALRQCEETNSVDKRVEEQIDNYIKQITDSLKQFLRCYERVFQDDKLDELDISATKGLFAQAKEQARELQTQISQSKAKAKELKKNYTHKTIATLIGHTLYFSHSGIVLHFANQYLSRGVVLWILRACFCINPYFAFFCLVATVAVALYKFINTDNENIRIKIYEFYCVLDSLIIQIRSQNGAIGMLVDIDKSVSGNAVVIDNKFLRYLTAPLPYNLNILIQSNRNLLDEAICYNINVNGNGNVPINIRSLFTENNYDGQNYVGKEELFAFSTFPSFTKIPLQNEDIVNTSAFKHIQHIMLQFSSFLCIQSPHFASTLVLDMLLQSFKTSPQSNQSIRDKFMLFITNPLETDSMHYKIHEYIKAKSRDSLQDNVLFLNVITRIKKQELFKGFKKQIYDNYKNLEKIYNDTHTLKEWLYPCKINSLQKLLETFSQYENKNIAEIANEFSQINKLILEQKHLFDEEFYNGTPKAKRYANNLLSSLLVFDSVFSCFLEFGIKRDKQQTLDEKTLSELKNKARDKIANIQKLSKTAFCITHILNNAYFSDNPTKEIQFITNLYAHSTQYQIYKQILKDYEVYLPNQWYIDAINVFMPFQSDFLLEFFYADEIEELCKFIYYLIDLETGGIFLFYARHFCDIATQYQASKIKKQDLQDKNSSKKYENIIQDKFIDYIVSHIKNNIVAYLIGIAVKDTIKDINTQLRDAKFASQRISEVLQNIINDNQERLGRLLEAMKEKQEKDMLRVFSQIHNIQEQIGFDNYDEASKLIDVIRMGNTKIFQVIFSLSKKMIQKSLPLSLILELYECILDEIFPTLLDGHLKRDITMFMLGIRAKKDRQYAKWDTQDEYFYIPKDLHKTLIVGDFKHSLLLDTSLDIGYCTINTSIGAYTKNNNLAQKQCKDMIKNNLYAYNPYYFSRMQDSEVTQIYKEAYESVHYYIDNIQSKQSQAKQEAIPRFANLINSDIIQTKLQYQKSQYNKKYQSIGEKTNAQRDFIIQLKRVAEYSYRAYKGERTLNKSLENIDKSMAESILSNLFYNPSFIPTKIDIHKEL